jgi:hypothetical protein
MSSVEFEALQASRRLECTAKTPAAAGTVVGSNTAAECTTAEQKRVVGEWADERDIVAVGRIAVQLRMDYGL